jgi:RimJ/RimL family protein N-acetyltransferase
LWWFGLTGELRVPARLQCSLEHPVLATRHLRLRELSAADLVSLQALWRGDSLGIDPDGLVSNSEDVAIQATAPIRMDDSSVHWAVSRLNSDELLGYFCLQDIDLEHSQAELRFWMEPQPGWVQRAVEAGQAVLAYAFGNLSLITVHAFSACSQYSAYEVLTRIGMRPLEPNSRARESWERCPEVDVWNIARHRWMRAIPM